jgi:glucan 1,3-beta-glucosidase
MLQIVILCPVRCQTGVLVRTKVIQMRLPTNHAPAQTQGRLGEKPVQTKNLITLKCIALLLIASTALLASCGGGGNSNQQTPRPPSLSFIAIPGPSVSLGTQIPALNLTTFVQGGTPPYKYSLVTQSAPTVISAVLNGSTLTSDYAYQAGANTITIQVTDNASANATSSVTVTVTSPAVSYKIFGIDFSPYEAGQSPSSGAISIDQITRRMGVIAPYTQWVRSYSSANGLENIGAIAHKFGLKACMGATLASQNSPNNNAMEMTNLIQHALSGDADCAIVGNETLSSTGGTPSPLTATQLVQYIDQFKSAVPNVPVATSDTYFDLLNNPSVVNEGNFIFVNYYPYWEGSDISVALSLLNAEDALLRLTYPNLANKVWVSETGWPSGGNSVTSVTGTTSATPSPTNAASYFSGFESWSKSNQRSSFYFEGFDEAWKSTSVTPPSPQQGMFGVFDESAVMKYGGDVFAGQTQADSWTCTSIPGGAGSPSIQLTSVPPRQPSEPAGGSGSYLQGLSLHIAPIQFYVVVFIHVGASGWYMKPYQTSPKTIVNCDGTWDVNIDTGGQDATADQVAAFLIPPTYSVPPVLGLQTLPADLYTSSLVNAVVTRP